MTAFYIDTEVVQEVCISNLDDTRTWLSILGSQVHWSKKAARSMKPKTNFLAIIIVFDLSGKEVKKLPDRMKNC